MFCLFFTFRSFLVTSVWETARMVPDSQGHSATRSKSQLSWAPSLPSAADRLRNRFPTNTGQLSPSVSTMVSTPAGRAPPCKRHKNKMRWGRPRSEAARRAEAPTGTGGVTPPRVDPAPQAAARASPPPSCPPPPQTPARVPRDPLALPTFAFSKPFKAGRRGREGRAEPQRQSFFLSVRPLAPAKKRLPQSRGTVPAAGPRPGRPRSRRGLARDSTLAAPPPPASGPPTRAHPRPACAANPGDAASARAGPSPFSPGLPQPRPAARLPRLPPP